MFNVRKLDLLVSLYIFCIAVSELMGLKTFPLLRLGTFQLNASVGIFVVPVIYSINDIITEVHGKDRARSIVRAGLFVVFLFMVTSFFFTALPPSSRFQTTEPSYDAVFHTSARIAFSSLTAFALAEFLDVFIFVKVRERFGAKRLWLRNNLSNIISEFFDTTVFMTLAFYALDHSLQANLTFLTSLILPYWMLKCVMSVIETPFVYLGVRWLKKGDRAE